MSARKFMVYLSNGETKSVSAPSLRTALRKLDKEPVEILAMIACECLPEPAKEEVPFRAVLLRNPLYVAPEQ